MKTRFNPEYAFDHLLLPCNLKNANVQLLRSKSPVKLPVSLPQHTKTGMPYSRNCQFLWPFGPPDQVQMHNPGLITVMNKFD